MNYFQKVCCYYRTNRLQYKVKITSMKKHKLKCISYATTINLQAIISL
jgi:hypothetical protein